MRHDRPTVPVAQSPREKYGAGRLSGIDVARVVKKLADRAGLDAANYAGAFAPSRTCHQRGHCRGVRAVHHEPDGAPLGSDGTALHPRRKSVPGEQCRQVGPIG